MVGGWVVVGCEFCGEVGWGGGVVKGVDTSHKDTHAHTHTHTHTVPHTDGGMCK